MDKLFTKAVWDDFSQNPPKTIENHEISKLPKIDGDKENQYSNDFQQSILTN